MMSLSNCSWIKRTCASVGLIALAAGFHSAAWGMELDWSGQFRAETHWLRNYTLDGNNANPDPARTGQGGYYVPGGGSSNANFQSLFLKLKPKLVVNDNIYIKSEWWLGDPVYGFFGDAAPYSSDQRQFYSTQSRGSTIRAQRFWAEFLSDIGTVQVGRAPLNWGLGINWNAGDGLWDRYESTGDVVRMISKFGAFSFIPSFIKYSLGNTLGGACSIDPTTGSCTTTTGGGGVTDYSLIFKYDNLDEDFEGGLNFIKRLVDISQDPRSGYLGVNNTAASMNFNVWDLYGRKKVGKFVFGAEVPITTGTISGTKYNTYAVALEGNYKPNDTFEMGVKAGHAPGQGGDSTFTPDKYRAFYFNPNYKLGLIMFNYNLFNLSGQQTLTNPGAQADQLASPFDNPIVNANDLAFSGGYTANKWNFHSTWIFASAVESASSGLNFYNHYSRKFVANKAGTDQEKFMGWEMDYGTTFKWDDNFQFGLDFGLYFPGGFYKFSNVPGVENPTSTVFATAIKAGVSF